MKKTLNHYTQEGLNSILGCKLDPDGIIGKKTTDQCKILYRKILNHFQEKEYRWNHINVIGVRMNDSYTNQFSDWLIITKGESLVIVPFSTVPGWGYVMNKQYIGEKKGVAVLKEGMYYDFWARGTTSWTGKKYLQQYKPCNIYRDDNMDENIDRDSTKIYNGNFGINFHSWLNFLSNLVGRLSAGCQVMRADILELIWDYIDLALYEQGGSIDYLLIRNYDL